MKTILEYGFYLLAGLTVALVLTAFLAQLMPTTEQLEPIAKVLLKL